MLDTSSRLLRLLTLLQSRRYWPGHELSERLAVTSRTVRRDVDRLRGLGYPVESSSGLAGGYQLAAGSNLPPLLLDDDEALAVAGPAPGDHRHRGRHGARKKGSGSRKKGSAQKGVRFIYHPSAAAHAV